MPRNCFGEEELTYLREVIESQDAWRWGRSNFVPRFEEAFGAHLGRKYVHAVNSGTSANTTAYASLGLDVGRRNNLSGCGTDFRVLPSRCDRLRSCICRRRSENTDYFG